jgi:hypothetical protein
MVMDCHVWCVDEKSVVHDYPDEQLIKGDHWTSDVMRSSRDLNPVIKALPNIEKLSKDKFFDENKRVSTEPFLSMIVNNTITVRNCYACAKLFHDSDQS